MFQVTLNGIILTDQPDLSEFTTNFVRDDEEKGLFTKYPESITLHGQGYEIVRALFDADYCSEASIKIEKKCDAGFRELTTAIVFIRTAVLNRSRCTVTVDIQEDTFSARIFNNKDIKVNVGSKESKNGVAITPVPLLGGMEMWATDGIDLLTPIFDTGLNEPGFAHAGRRQFFDIMDVLEFLVSWMTDGEATIQSDWYDNIGAINKTGIMTGKELRLGDDHTGELPEVSFAQVYQFLNRSFNLFMTIQGTPGNRVVRIEGQAFFRDTTAVITLNLLDDVEESIKQELLYSHVKFGGEETLVSDTPDFPIIPLLGHQIEEFHLQGTCNINNALDLELPFIVDHNLILDVLLNDNESTDSNIVAVQYNRSVTPKRATNLDPFDVGQIVYNQLYLNNEIIERYELQGAVAKYLPGGDDNRFLAATFNNFSWTSGASVTVEQQVPFFNDFDAPWFDTSNNYGNGTPQGTLVPVNDARYTAPAPGLYSFEVNLHWQREGTAGFTDSATIKIQRFDSADALVDEKVLSLGQLWVNLSGNLTTNHINEIFWTTYLKTGDYVTVTHIMDGDVGGFMKFLAPSTFACLVSFDGGGIYEEKDADLYYLYNYEFTRPIEEDKYHLLAADPVKAIDISFDGSRFIRTYIDNVNVNNETNETDWLLITNPNNTRIV